MSMASLRQRANARNRLRRSASAIGCVRGGRTALFTDRKRVIGCCAATCVQVLPNGTVGPKRIGGNDPLTVGGKVTMMGEAVIGTAQRGHWPTPPRAGVDTFPLWNSEAFTVAGVFTKGSAQFSIQKNSEPA